MTALISSAEEITGIIPGQIWYSTDSLKEGETVKIYTAIWNDTKQNLSTKVEFYDKNVILGTRDITILPDQVSGVNVSWKVTSGDHLVSAKIISSVLNKQGIKDPIVLSRVSTNLDKKFVPAIVTNIDGSPATSADVVKSQIDKASSRISEAIPDSVGQPVSNLFGNIETFKNKIFNQIIQSKAKTKAEIKGMENKEGTIGNSATLNKTDKPIAYLKLFFLSVIYFIFSSKILFYGIIFLLIFLIIRYLYLKLKYK